MRLSNWSTFCRSRSRQRAIKSIPASIIKWCRHVFAPYCRSIIASSRRTVRQQYSYTDAAEIRPQHGWYGKLRGLGGQSPNYPLDSRVLRDLPLMRTVTMLQSNTFDLPPRSVNGRSTWSRSPLTKLLKTKLEPAWCAGGYDMFDSDIQLRRHDRSLSLTQFNLNRSKCNLAAASSSFSISDRTSVTNAKQVRSATRIGSPFKQMLFPITGVIKSRYIPHPAFAAR